MTQFAKPSETKAPRLNTFMDQVIALTWTRDGVVSTRVENELRHTQAAEAYIISVDLEKNSAVGMGTTLVFPQVLQQTVRNNKGRYVLGRLTKTERDNGFSLITLEDLPDEDHMKAVALIEDSTDWLFDVSHDEQPEPTVSVGAASLDEF